MTSERKMPGSVCCVGLCCLDIISIVPFYPSEDTDSRCETQIWSIGGNATNNSTVLNQLGHDCTLFAAIAEDHTLHTVKQKLNEALLTKSAILCIRAKDTGEKLPVSVATVNSINGSRTILHAPNNITEPTAKEFKEKLLDASNFGKYSWFHFEGRNLNEVRAMIDALLELKKGSSHHSFAISVEIEKSNKPDIEMLIPGCDVVFISKEFSKSRGCMNMNEAVKAVGSSGQVVVCGWGEEGACVKDRTGQIHSTPIHKAGPVVDTLGAGDTFIAGTIKALNEGHIPQEAIKYGCYVSGVKVTKQGLLNILK